MLVLEVMVGDVMVMIEIMIEGEMLVSPSVLVGTTCACQGSSLMFI